MKKSLLLPLLIAGFFSSSVASADQYVRGHYRSDGTYVQGHYRSSPNSTRLDNYSTRGNTNPYTGQSGYKSPYGNSSGGNSGYGNSYQNSYGNRR